VEMSVGPVEDNMFHWQGILYGPKKSPYAEGVFKFNVKFPKNYPMNPPEVTFITKMFHPNIDERNGNICVDILRNKWTSVYTISTVMISISSLLTDPNPSSPMNPLCAKLYMTDRNMYNAKVKEYVKKYANSENL
jgi:ubiquitin-conjugating enzyme E2 D